MKKITFAVLGDCCVDTFVREKKTFLGGTAFNVAYAARGAGAATTLISSVGRDTYGKMYLDACKELSINTAYLTTRSGNTSSVDIILDEKNTLQFANWDIGVLKRRILTTREKNFLSTQDIARAVLFKPVSAMFASFCVLDMPKTLKIGDFLGVSDYSYRTSPIKKYAKYLDVIVKSVEEKEQENLTFLHAVAKEYKKIVLALLGSNGSVVFTKDRTYTCPVLQAKVVDTTGAGDAYQAYFAYWYKKTKNIPLAMEKATKAATETITHIGASYPIPVF